MTENESIQSEQKMGTLQRMMGELGKLQEGLQVVLAQKMQQNFSAELKSIKSFKNSRNEVGSNYSNSIVNSPSRRKHQVSSLGDVGRSADIKNTTYGTNISKGLFTDMSISNFSNLDEHEIMEQSKLADQKIMLLKK